MNEQKFLDESGVVHLYNKLSLQDYPNNETLIGVITAIDETKADKNEIPTTPEAVNADPVGSALESLIEAKSYADTAIAALVNSAPETLDTLGELAAAFQKNADMVATLDAAVTNKAEKSDLDNLAELVDLNATNINSLQSELFNLIYPIGAIYLSAIEVSPSILFGGTWEQIKDVFLLAAGDTYTAGSTGGEAEHTLTYKELPKTNGAIVMHNASYGTNIAGVSGCFTSSTTNQGTYRNGGSALEADTVSIGKINYSNGGEDQPHNNMPPYLAVYMWKRIV